MTAVLGYASLSRFELPLSSPVQGHLAEIEKAARRSAELCRQLLAYAGKGRVSTESVDLNQLVEDSLGLLKLSIVNKVVLHLDLLPGLPILEGDPTQLRQVLMNLVFNAAEALGERSGLITISTGVMRAGAEYLAEFHGSDRLAPGDYSFLEVRDNGCGMSAQTISQIFEPFYTAAGPRGAARQGSGQHDPSEAGVARHEVCAHELERRRDERTLCRGHRSGRRGGRIQGVVADGARGGRGLAGQLQRKAEHGQPAELDAAVAVADRGQD